MGEDGLRMLTFIIALIGQWGDPNASAPWSNNDPSSLLEGEGHVFTHEPIVSNKQDT
jgi:hypothetical protein